MTTHHRRKLVTMVLIALVLWVPTAAGATTAGATIILEFSPPTLAIQKGNTFGVALLAHIDQSSPVVSFGLDVEFNPTILDTIDTVVGSQWNAGSLVDFSKDGVISVTGFSLTPITTPPPDPFVTLANLFFDTQELGTTTLTPTFPDFPVTDGFGQPFPPGGVVNRNKVKVNVATVAVVPEPSTFLLLGSGLAGVGVWRWRKAKVDNV